MTFEYNHDVAITSIHDVLYDLVPDFKNVRLMCEKFDPDETTWSDLEESDPEAYKVYIDLSGEIMDRLEENDIIPSTRGEDNFCEKYPSESDLFFDELDEQIENFVYGYRDQMFIAS